MTKKELVALADHIKRFGFDTEFNGGGIRVIGLENLADFCAEQNPNFKREQWLGYIHGKNGPNGGKIE